MALIGPEVRSPNVSSYPLSSNSARTHGGTSYVACVSPPQPSTAHIVAVSASIAQAASTALPPCWKIMAPAVAASGLPVIATQCFAWRTGLAVRWACRLAGVTATTSS